MIFIGPMNYWETCDGEITGNYGVNNMKPNLFNFLKKCSVDTPAQQVATCSSKAVCEINDETYQHIEFAVITISDLMCLNCK